MLSSAIAVFAGSLIGALIVKTTAWPSGTKLGQRGFQSAYESQSHLIESKAKLRGPEPRDDLALDRVGVDRRRFCGLDICPPMRGRLESLSHMRRNQPISFAGSASARYNATRP